MDSVVPAVVRVGNGNVAKIEGGAAILVSDDRSCGDVENMSIVNCGRFNMRRRAYAGLDGGGSGSRGDGGQ